MSTPGGYGQDPQNPGGAPIDPGTGRPYGQALPPGTEAVAPGGPAGDGRRSMAWFWVGAAVVAIALGAAGYFFGKSQGEKEYDPGTADYKAIYDTGYQAGATAGTAAGAKAGAKAGEQKGKQAGLQQGVAQGQAQGTADGASAALGGFATWDTGGTFYVVKMAEGSQKEVPYVVESRVTMSPTTYYSPCEGNPSELCTFPRPPASTGGTKAP